MLQVICPRFLVPVRPRSRVFENWAIVIDTENGEVVALGESASLIRRFPRAEQVNLKEHALIPGLINMHTHSPMTLLRGYADDLKLDDWLQNHIWPAEQRWANEEFVTDGTRLALVEMLRSGTTCFSENYFFPDRIAAEAERAGIRATVGIPVIEFETAWADSIDQYIGKGIELEQDYRASKRINFSFAPHALYSVPRTALEQVVRHAEQLGLKIHLHLLETAWEIDHARAQGYGHPLELARQLGMLNPGLLAVHMVHLEDSDIDLLADTGANVIHCPHSNLKLASGMCRLADLVAQGVNVAVGTDGVAANNTLSMFDEIRTAALLAKGRTQDPEVVDAMTALEMATINGARALGMEQTIGSIEKGKQADLCAIDFRHARTQPVHDVISHLVYAAPGHQVSDIWVAGQQLLKQGELTTLDEHRILDKASAWAMKMSAGAFS
ncbi:MAG: TRZ/ATZ family hydrolase [Xanthomonadales bacterium]|nr:TRZ/ATZ family hydrolase [Xanthomonadales bacterium]